MYLFFGDFLAGAPYQKKIWWPKFPNDYETLIHHVPLFRMMQWFFPRQQFHPDLCGSWKGLQGCTRLWPWWSTWSSTQTALFRLGGLDKKFSWQTAMWLMLAPCSRCGPWKEYCRGYWPLALQDLVCDPVQAHAFAKQASGAVPSLINVHEIVAFTIPK